MVEQEYDTKQDKPTRKALTPVEQQIQSGYLCLISNCNCPNNIRKHKLVGACVVCGTKTPTKWHEGKLCRGCFDKDPSAVLDHMPRETTTRSEFEDILDALPWEMRYNEYRTHRS